MAIEWIKAPLALKYVALGECDYPSRAKICERAYSGLIAAKADLLIWDETESRNKRVPKELWWTEGREALEQDWETGDFSTWSDEQFEIKAFGVSFDFLAISELVPADKQAIAMRAISMMAEDDWISASELQRLMFAKVNPAMAGDAIIEACKLGQIAGRAMRASGEGSGRSTANGWAAIEWDIPLWFWRGFTDFERSSHDWQMGTAKGRGVGPSGSDFIKLQGVHFHRSGLVNLGLAQLGEAEQSKRGRKATYDWQQATSAVWGQLVRGELIPDNQAMIERALIILLTRGDKEPSESTVRPYAKQIWDEFTKA